MARVMYLDCFSGAAGDMLLGALLDAGLPLDALREALGSLGVDHDVQISRVVRAGITATKFDVIEHRDAESRSRGRRTATHAHDHGTDGPHHDHGADGHRTLKEIRHLVGHSSLSPAGKTKAVELFGRLAQIEADIHGISVDEVHLHEVGALDSIIDIAGVVFAMEWLGIDDVVSSPLNVGGGTVQIAHGRFPVPAPATLRLLEHVPVYSDGPKVELVTPTGALLVSAYAREYGAMPAMSVSQIGYGAGTRDTPHTPNVLRVVIGERTDAPAGDRPVERVLKIECEIDDMNPQLFPPASERLFQAGALDVFLTPVLMKKGRPGTLVTVLAPVEKRGAIVDTLFRETTTIGVRVERVERETLERRWETVETTGGPVRIKIATRHGVVVSATPEFEDCLRIAQATGVPVKTIQAEAVGKAWGLGRGAWGKA
jgi:uncharacterized protein (TIGR00299 family) protein